MPDIHNTTSQEVRRSVNVVPPFDAAPWWIIDRTETERIEAIPLQYRKMVNDTVVWMTAQEKATVDMAREDADLDAQVAEQDALLTTILEVVNQGREGAVLKVDVQFRYKEALRRQRG